MKKALLSTTLFALFAWAGVANAAQPAKQATAGLELLKQLTGTWEAAGPGGKVMRVSFKPISEGTAVLESHEGDGHSDSMITIYHMDGGDLVLTHYCSMGNAPRMRAKVTPGAKELVFAYMDATNVDKDGAHMHKLIVRLDDADHLTQEWTMKDGAKETPVPLRFTRKKV
jgi:hypothetical protein